MKNKERIQLLENRLNIHSKLLDNILTKLELDNDPQLKQIDQSVFNGLDSKWLYAAIDGCTSRAYVYEQKPHFSHDKDYWCTHEGLQRIVGEGYDTTNWQTSLIEREAIELTGSDLCKAMLERGDKYVMCLLSDTSHAGALSSSKPRIITHFTDDMGFIEYPKDLYWHFAVPINNQGEPLTSIDVGL